MLGLDTFFLRRRGLDRLLATASQQRVRQLRRVHQLQRQAEKQLALNRAHEEKLEKDRLRQLAQEVQIRKAKAERQLQDALVEVSHRTSSIVHCCKILNLLGQVIIPLSLWRTLYCTLYAIYFRMSVLSCSVTGSVVLG